MSLIVLAFVVGAIGVVAGGMIGCVGVGGVIVVPALVYGLGMDVQDAIACAMMGYILTGVIGTTVYARARSIRWELAGWISLGAAPGALFGAWAISGVEPRLLEFGVGALALASGLNSLFGRRKPSAAEPRSLRAAELVLVGLVTGVLSAITGTGGPLVLVPILICLKLPTLTAVGLSQAAQIPIATLATIGNFAYGDPDVSQGVALGIGLALGTWFGAKVAHALPRRTLETVAAGVLLSVGWLVLARLGFRQFV
ncbi:sulfite exporter TauE/SafE family protein [Hansschlegelia zhihuaiae]|uniref:Probable membrane transporter protein n=1 Tax=Hansschlegelia zhihuaiae TaxID=405005 RepID=A0A4Q0MNZ5_9HYPH|nr:sulfite exporter TauE/SafE family protein [Hansschlegelia zhihuaiae]RXF75558.1 sulfite exporter TauE/SafE family protein [Hansschlegelia zhihuaiae]